MAFADVVALLVTYLTPIVTPVPVASRVPKNRPAELIQVRRVGGGPLQPVREVVRLDVFAWADTDPRAHELGTQVRQAIWDLYGTDTLGVVTYVVDEFLASRTDDDSETGGSRSWATYDLTVRADEVIHPPAT